MYLNINIADAMIDYNCYFEGSTTCYSESSMKGYELIEHAYDLLKNNNAFYLSDVISNLRKAINYRVMALFECLGIDNLQFDDLGKNRKLEKLEYLDIVKPLLINKLLEIRNGIEYNGNAPPTQRECEELIDIVWYFYRSTDCFCNKKPDSLLIEFNDSNNFLILDFDFREHKILKINGRMKANLFSENQISDESILLYDFHSNKLDTIKDADDSSDYIAFTANIKVDGYKGYFDVFSIAITEWGNFLF